MATAHYRELDGLRGLAAQLVLFAHASVLTLEPQLLPAWLARFAVIVFFVLSGFAIATSIKSRALSSGQWDWMDYAIRRVARIYPPYIVAVVSAAALAAMHNAGWTLSNVATGTEITNGPVSWLRTLLFLYRSSDAMTSVDGPSWSLRLEVALYIVSGLITFAWFARGLLRALFLTCAAAFLVICCFRLSYMFTAAILFASGSFAAFVVNGPPRLRSWKVQIGICVVLLSPVILPSLIDDSEISFIYQAALGPVLALGLIWLAHSGLANGSLLSRLIVASGNWSYTLYIMHAPILIVLYLLFAGATAAGIPVAGMFVFYVVLTNAICWAIALAVERPSYYAKLLRKCVAQVVPVSAQFPYLLKKPRP